MTKKKRRLHHRVVHHPHVWTIAKKFHILLVLSCVAVIAFCAWEKSKEAKMHETLQHIAVAILAERMATKWSE